MIRSQRRVRKRDGREVPFDQGKIADAIFRAARSVGGGDRLLAEELASVVTMFLDKDAPDRVPSIDDISDLIEKVLVETGHARTAKAFILERDRRERIRSALRVRHEDESAREGRPRVDARTHATVRPWSKGKIVEALMVEADLEPAVAEEIASEVERRVFQSGLTRVSTTLIRALVDNELFERGYDRVLRRQQVIGLPRYDLDRMARSGAADAGEEAAHVAPEEAILRSIWTQYSLDEIYPPQVVEAHLTGRIHTGALGSPGCYQGLFVDVAEAGAEGEDPPGPALRLAVSAALGLVEEGVTVLGADAWAARAVEGLGSPEAAAELLLHSLAEPRESGRSRPGVELRLPLRPGAAWSSAGDEAAARERWRGFLLHVVRTASRLSVRARLPRVVIDVAECQEADEALLLEAAVAEAPDGAVSFLSEPAIGGVLTRWSPVILRVDVNLAQAAYRGRRFDAKSVFEQLDAALSLAADACEARSTWLNGLSGRASPRERMRHLSRSAPAAAGSGRFEIGLAGLDAACRAAFDRSLWRDERARGFAFSLIDRARLAVTRLARERRLPLALGFSVDSEVLGRFGRTDFERFPRGRDVHGVGHDGRRYLYGCTLGSAEREPDPDECAEVEAALRRDLVPTRLPIHHSSAHDRVRFLRRFAGALRGNSRPCS